MWKNNNRTPILIAILVQLPIFLFLVFGVRGAASEPPADGDDPFYVESLAIAGGDEREDAVYTAAIPSDEPVVSDEPAETEQPDEPEEDVFFTVLMDSSDIYRGSLLLINADHPYEIPDDAGLIVINDDKTMTYRISSPNLLLYSGAMQALNDMMDVFYEETGRDNVTVTSAFRDNKRQQEILDDYTARMGRKEALRWAALPGHSEHHAGLAVDFGLFSSGEVRTFRGTGVYSWFGENAHRFGFLLRYPENKTEITGAAYEPWHFRFVGEPHSYFIYQRGFVLEEYIEFIRSFSADNSFTDIYNEIIYEVYYTQDLEIVIPDDSEPTISGNNIDGFIVTLKH